MQNSFLRKMASVALIASLLGGYMVPTTYAVPYPLDGSFTKTVVQTMQTARAETKAVSVISFYAHIYTGQNSVSIDGFLFNFYGGYGSLPSSVSPTGVNVQTYDATNTSGITAAGQLIGIMTGFTSPTSGIAYDLTRASNNITITTRGTETRDGLGIPENRGATNFSVFTYPGYTTRAARPEIVDFTPANVNPAANEEYMLTLSGMTYSATGTTVSEITGKIVAATIASPSPAGTCVDNTTKITCTSINDTTSLSSSASVNYLTPDTTAPIMTLVGGVAYSFVIGDTYSEPGATWIDNRDGTGSVSAPYSGSVNTALPGTYTLSYRYIDAGANSSNIATRTVEVSDVTPQS